MFFARPPKASPDMYLQGMLLFCRVAKTAVNHSRISKDGICNNVILTTWGQQSNCFLFSIWGESLSLYRQWYFCTLCVKLILNTGRFMYVCTIKAPYSNSWLVLHSAAYCFSSCRFSCQMELHHYQFLTSQFSSSNLLNTWANGSSSSVLDAFMRLDNYKKQLLSGVLCINMDVQGSFRTKPVSPDESPPSILPPEGLTMQIDGLPPAVDCGEIISSSSVKSLWQVYAAEAAALSFKFTDSRSRKNTERNLNQISVSVYCLVFRSFQASSCQEKSTQSHNMGWK